MAPGYPIAITQSGESMETLIWMGAMVTLLGLGGVIWSLVSVLRARRANLDDTTLRDRMKRLLPLNVASLFLSFLGLIIVVVGIILT